MFNFTVNITLRVFNEENDNMVEKSKLGHFEIFDFLHW